ncbi:MAG: cold-shock protein [Acidimicrobiia bacterium]|nr:cold-shock protein [Acidimicrobiia bacterium]
MAQGTVNSYDPITGAGLILDDSGEDVPLADDALEGSLFRVLRQGQRVNYDRVEVDGTILATRVRFGHGGA